MTFAKETSMFLDKKMDYLPLEPENNGTVGILDSIYSKDQYGNNLLQH